MQRFENVEKINMKINALNTDKKERCKNENLEKCILCSIFRDIIGTCSLSSSFLDRKCIILSNICIFCVSCVFFVTRVSG